MPNLRVKASLDRSDYEKGLDAMKNASKGLNNSLQGLGGIGGMVAGVFGGNLITSALSRVWDSISSSISRTREEMVQLGYESENIGINPEKLNDIQDVFEHFGQSGDVVVSMFGRMAAARDKAMSGNEKMAVSFREIGISLEQLAKMSDAEAFDVLTKKFSMGEGKAAVGEILGKAIKSPGTRRALTEYGRGTRVDMVEPTEIEIVRQQMADRAGKEARKSHGNALWPRLMNIINPVQWARKGVFSDEVVKTEIASRESEMKKAALQAEAERLKTEQRKAANKTALAAEETRYVKDQEAERKEEIEHGLHVQRPEADAYRRRGIMVGGGIVNDQAYQVGRRQVQIQTQIAETLRRIEANTAIAKRHKEALLAIKSQYAAGDFEPKVE